MRTTLATTLAAALAVAAFAVPSAAATPSPVPSAAATPSPVPSTAAAVLDRQVQRLEDDVAAQAARLQQAQVAAGRALEAEQLAERAAAQAERKAEEAAAVLVAAQAEVVRAKGGLDGFAGALYRNGPAQQGMSYVAAALVSRDPSALLHDVEVAEQIGDGKGATYQDFRAAEVLQREAVRRSKVTRDAAVRLRTQAGAAKQAARKAVAAQAALVTQRRLQLAETLDAADAAHLREELLAKAERIALERSLQDVPLSALAGALVPRPTGTCQGGDLAGYPNGMLPESGLCPLWGTAGQILRADAAAAFNALSRRYAEQHGFPLCVTDSYRDFPEQVAVRIAKPTLAAVPGTSNHGWGVALDLCGGAEHFGTPLHLWLVANAAEFGWFLPSWAQAGGTKPEPWHWEYAGR